MDEAPILKVVFFRYDAGREPVKEWLRDLPKEDRKTIGEDIKLVQFRWPLGMPLVRKMESNLWKVRTRLSGGRSARFFFTARQGEMVLLHGYFKKSDKTPTEEMNLARARRDQWRGKDEQQY